MGAVEPLAFRKNGLAPVERVASDPALEPRHRLGVILEELQRCADDLQRTRAYADSLGPAATPDQVAQAVRQAQLAYRRWYDVQTQALGLEQETRRRQLEDLTHFQQQIDQTTEALLGEYGDLGPQYRLLVQRAAAVDTRLRLLERSGRDVSPNEYAELHRTHLSYVAQLQRYTEAQKSEVLTQQTQDTVQAVLLIIEHKVAPTNPQMWREIVTDVRHALAEAAP
jgi:hypothetical protein